MKCWLHYAMLAMLALTGCVAQRGALVRPGWATANPGVNYYVSLTGDDRGDGSEGRPFRSLSRAQQAVREDKRRGHEPITVHLRGGVYRLSEPWRFTSEDNGASGAPVRWQAYGAEEVVISGGREVKNWQVGADGIWRASLPDAGEAGGPVASQLFVNEERRPRCRLPKKGFFRSPGGGGTPWTVKEEGRKDPRNMDTFLFKEGDLRAWDDVQNGQVWFYAAWTASIHWLESVDETNRKARLAAGLRGSWPLGFFERGNTRYHVENVRAALTEAGEWYMDHAGKVLHYLPKPGERPETVSAVVPVLPELLVLAGDALGGKPVEHLEFAGMSFRHNAFVLPRNQVCDGQGGIQGVVRVTGAAVCVFGSSNCVFEDVDISRCGTYGLWLGKGSRGNVVRRCELHDLGSGGIIVGMPQRERKIKTGDNQIVNCFIHNAGLIVYAGCGVIILNSGDNVVRHCDIGDLYYTAVSLGWVWGYGVSDVKRNIVEYNHLHHLGYGVLSDMGGVYTLGVSDGTIVRGNHIHDINDYAYGSWGLYPDQGSSNIVFEDNVVHGCRSQGFHQHFGRENVVRNNIFALNGIGEVVLGRPEEHTSFRFTDNVVVTHHQDPAHEVLKRGKVELDRNLYWHVEGQPLYFGNVTWNEWREHYGYDRHSEQGDPGFVDVRNGDFTLKPGALGASRVSRAVEAWRKAGLEGPAWWTERARTMSVKEVIPEVKPRRVRRFIPPLNSGQTDDFEAEPAGELPLRAMVVGENEEACARIRVSDEAGAAGSRQSLKFTDAENLKHFYSPHLIYRAYAAKGEVVVSFDVLMKDKAALLWHEWRDSGQKFKAGPSMVISGRGHVELGGRRHPLDVSGWVHVEIRCQTGDKAAGTYEVTLTPASGTAVQLKDAPMLHGDWRTLDKLLFISSATVTTDFFVDNVRFEVRGE